MQVPTNFVPATPPHKRHDGDTLALLALLLGTLALLAALGVLATYTLRQAGARAESAYRLAADAEVKKIAAANQKIRDESLTTAQLVALLDQNAAATTASLKRLEQIEPPAKAKTFHAALLETLRHCERAVTLAASAEGNVLALMAWTPDIRAGYAACEDGLAKLDLETLTVRD